MQPLVKKFAMPRIHCRVFQSVVALVRALIGIERHSGVGSKSKGMQRDVVRMRGGKEKQIGVR